MLLALSAASGRSRDRARTRASPSPLGGGWRAWGGPSPARAPGGSQGDKGPPKVHVGPADRFGQSRKHGLCPQRRSVGLSHIHPETLRSHHSNSQVPKAWKEHQRPGPHTCSVICHSGWLSSSPSTGPARAALCFCQRKSSCPGRGALLLSVTQALRGEDRKLRMNFSLLKIYEINA